MKITAIKRFSLVLLAFAMAVLTFGQDVDAQQRRVPASKAEERLSYAPVVRRAAPAVVNVYVRRQVKQRISPFFDDPFFRRFMGRDFGRPQARIQSSLGSGVIVSPDGVIVTNHHVIKARGKAEIIIALADKREFPASVILKDERTDLAILKLNAPGVTFPFLEFEDSESLAVGDLVLAIGNPFGVGQTVTSGIVSALARTRFGVSDYQFFIQTDAAINPGNSGGALVDMNGKLVGVNTAIYSKTGGSHGIGFAIPSNMVNQVVQSALSGNKVRRPWFGADLQEVTPDIAKSLGIDRPAGALIKKVRRESPAEKAKLRTGDVIVHVEGKPVTDPRAFLYRFSTKSIGGSVKVGIIREGRIVTVSVPLIEAPEVPTRDELVLQGQTPLAGAKVANLSPALAEELSIDDEEYGVIIMGIERGSPANRTRFLRPGDIVVAINGERITDTRHLADVARKPSYQWQLSVKRRGRILNVVIGG